MEEKNVVVIGGGFGGLRAAKRIARALRRHNLHRRYSVLLINRNHYHTYTPLLYEVSTTSKTSANLKLLQELVAYDLRVLLPHHGVTFMQQTVSDIDPATGRIALGGGGVVAAAAIVLAPGTETNFFDIPGLKEHALPLKTFLDAAKLRETIVARVGEGISPLRIIVGGGGSTGVELSGELKAWERELRDEYPTTRFEVTIVQRDHSILPGFAPSIIRRAEARLRKLGVQIRASAAITNVETNTVTLDGITSVPYDILAWTGGVKVSDFIAKLPLELETRGQLKVEKSLGCISRTQTLTLGTHLYAIGDVACVHDPKTGAPMPGVARAALSEAVIAAHNVMEDILAAEGKIPSPRYRTYTPLHYPYIIPIGGKYAIAKIGPFEFGGIAGWLLKECVELGYLLSIFPLPRALSIWIRTLVIFIKNDRLG